MSSLPDLDNDLDALLANAETAPPTLSGAAERPAPKPIPDPIRQRRGRQSRNYGNRAELAVARKYGGEKIGHAGGPVDVRGKEWNVQVKTHRRQPPAEWRKAFGGMAASGERLPRLLLRFLPGPGLPPDDYFVIPAKAWLDWFGKDE